MPAILARPRTALSVWSCLALTACRGQAPAQTAAQQAPGGPPTIEVVKVVEQPLDVTLSLPGELNPHQSVALFARVSGFVKTIRVDRGSQVRAGESIAVLEAPELVAQRSEAQSKLQAAEAQLGSVRSKAEADASTYDRLKAAAATPGVVAGNDLVVAQKAVEADQAQIAAAQQTVEAARQALNSIRDVEGYLRITAPFAGVVTERNVHPGALVGPGTATPIVRIVDSHRLRLVVPVPESYTAGVKAGAVLSFSVAAYPAQTFSGTVSRIAQTIDVGTRTMAVELDVNNADGRLVARHLLSGSLARTSELAIAPRAAWQHREHDRTHVRHSRARRSDRMGRCENRARVRHPRGSIRRPETRRRDRFSRNRRDSSRDARGRQTDEGCVTIE